MLLSDIQVGRTYEGAIDYKRGIGPHRKVIEHDKEYGIITLKNVVGPNPPPAYLDLATMGAAEFAAWAQREVVPEGAE